MLARPVRWLVVPFLLLAMMLGAVPAPAHEPDRIPVDDESRFAQPPADYEFWNAEYFEYKGDSASVLHDFSVASVYQRENGSPGGEVSCGLIPPGSNHKQLQSYATSCRVKVKLTTTRRIKRILGLNSRVVFKVVTEAVYPTYNGQGQGRPGYDARPSHFHFTMPRSAVRKLAPVERINVNGLTLTASVIGPASHGSTAFKLDPARNFSWSRDKSYGCPTRDPNLFIRERTKGPACPDGPATRSWYRG